MAARRSSGLTMRASCLLAAGLTALVCGVVLGVADLTRAGLLALLVPIAAYLVVHRARFRIGNRRSLEPERVTAGESVVVHLALRNNSRLPVGVLMLEDALPGQLNGRARFVLDGLAGKEERTVSYRIPMLPRGRYRSGPLRVRLTDPFHLIDLMRSFTPTADLLVGPAVERLPGVSAPRSQDVGDNAGSHSVGTHGADDASTREYRTGDDLRKIHWRSTARTGSLMVRQEERPWQGRGTVLLDLRATAHHRRENAPAGADPRAVDSLEWAVSAAASIATHLIGHRQPVQLLYDTATGAVPIPGPAQLRDLLAVVGPSRERELTALAAPLGRAARDSAVFAVLGTPSHSQAPGDLTTVRMLQDLRSGRPGTAGIALVLDSPTWAGFASGGPAGAAGGTVRALQAAGWRAVVVTAHDALPDVWARVLVGRGRPRQAARA